MAKRTTKTRRTASKQAKRDSRTITVHTGFDYYWHRNAVTRYEPGEHIVKGEVADFAVEKGYASEGKLGDDAAAATDTGSANIVDHADHADADRPADGSPVDHDAG